ncbi:TrmB family transcriptional regulator [Clostridiaceae bacterium UIB06]|uniref:TrmB family transcriptional regulator n=1 Tax=Clostridium thailandense TaxID=2794346 RepID=A0A949TXD7_9CLOT|nr:helix-turn-helix domain-containing protein [Clostridium thailandense]MBV7274283.1 TrmB family transcriptional regulator [Clostridium thailandense]MCH5136183.1 TrmB family transcriptional regulator [Clostridiaceae bacterium UIB06]
MNSNASIIEDMKSLGLSEYEVKAYLKLLGQYPVNGYILSKESGIPRSRIYEVLDSLKNKQLVFEQNDGKNTLYYPLEPELLINRLKKSFDNKLSNIEEYTKNIYSEEKSDSKLIVIKGRESIIDFLNLLISDAKKRISLSIWEEEINDIRRALKDAIDRGVVVKGIYFGRINSFEELVSHRRIERYLSEKKERYMTVTIDGIHVLYGVISRNEESKVTWIKDAGFVDMSEDYISHDLMVNLYSNKLEENERQEYENFMDNARKEYFGYTDEEFNSFK